MTSTSLAQSYLLKAGTRMRVLDVLMEQEAWSDVVREAQELVELALKGMLRQMGIDPPKWHDVGPILQEHQELLPPESRDAVPALVEVSRWLRREREFAFCGDVDFIPTEEYQREDALRALEGARLALDAARRLIPAP